MSTKNNTSNKASAACIVSALHPVLDTSLSDMALDGEVQIKVDETVKLDIPIEIHTQQHESSTQVSFSNMRLTGDLRIYVEQPINLKLPIIVDEKEKQQNTSEEPKTDREVQTNDEFETKREETKPIEPSVVPVLEEIRADTPRPPFMHPDENLKPEENTNASETQQEENKQTEPVEESQEQEPPVAVEESVSVQNEENVETASIQNDENTEKPKKINTRKIAESIHSEKPSELTEIPDEDLVHHPDDGPKSKEIFFDDPKDYRVEIHARDLPGMDESTMFFKFYLDYGKGWQQISGSTDDSENFIKCYRPICKIWPNGVFMSKNQIDASNHLKVEIWYFDKEQQFSFYFGQFESHTKYVAERMLEGGFRSMKLEGEGQPQKPEIDLIVQQN